MPSALSDPRSLIPESPQRPDGHFTDIRHPAAERWPGSCDEHLYAIADGERIIDRPNVA